MQTKTKKCKSCHKEKPFDEFSPVEGCKDGLRPSCKECRSEELKQRRADRRAQEAAQAREEEWRARRRRIVARYGVGPHNCMSRERQARP